MPRRRRRSSRPRGEVASTLKLKAMDESSRSSMAFSIGGPGAKRRGGEESFALGFDLGAGFQGFEQIAARYQDDEFMAVKFINKQHPADVRGGHAFRRRARRFPGMSGDRDLLDQIRGNDG